MTKKQRAYKTGSVTITVDDNWMIASITFSGRTYDRVCSGNPITIKGQGYHWEGESDQDYWEFNNAYGDKKEPGAIDVYVYTAGGRDVYRGRLDDAEVDIVDRSRARKKPKRKKDCPDLDKERAGSVLFVPVPSIWFGKSWDNDMTFDEVLKALKSDEHKKAVALMKQIDRQLGIKAELSSGINDSPNGACVVILHNIKTPLSSEKLRYIAAVKGKALIEKSPGQSSA